MSYKGYTNIWWVSSILNEYASLMTEYQADGIEDIMGGTAKYLEEASCLKTSRTVLTKLRR